MKHFLKEKKNLTTRDVQPMTTMNSNENPEKICFLFPQTFMNKSGLSVSAVAKFYKILPEDILVLHDEIEYPFGKI